MDKNAYQHNTSNAAHLVIYIHPIAFYLEGDFFYLFVFHQDEIVKYMRGINF